MWIKRTHLILLFVVLAILANGYRVDSASQLLASNLSIYIPAVSNYSPISHDWLGIDGGSVVSLAIDPQNPDVIYLGSWGSGVYKSIDGGQNWVATRDGLGNLLILSLAVDPHNSNIVYAGTYKDELYKSIDGGSTWFYSSNGIQDWAVVYTIAIDPVDSRRIFIGTRGKAGDCGGVSCPPWAGVVYKSEDAGTSWQPVLSNVGGSEHQFWAYSIAFDPLAPNRVLAAFDGSPGLLRSLDSGNTWSANDKGITNYIGRTVVFDPTSISPIIAYYGGWQAHQYPNVFKTTDGGDSWVQKVDGIEGMDVLRMAISNATPPTLYLCTGQNGLWKSADGGDTWQKNPLPILQPYDIAINRQNSRVIYAGGVNAGLYKSTDEGTTWVLSQRGMNQTWATSLLVSVMDGDHLFMSTYGQGVYESNDWGRTWTDISAGLLDLNIHAMTVNPVYPDVLYALTDTMGLFKYDVSNHSGWVSLSRDLSAFPEGSPVAGPEKPSLGPNYPLSPPEPPDSDIYPELYASQKIDSPDSIPPHLAIVFANSDPSIGYMGTWNAEVYKSIDFGFQWAPVGLPGYIVWSIAVDAEDADLVYAATSTPGSVIFSRNGGKDWEDSVLPDPNLLVYSLGTSPVDAGKLYAGTTDGVYRLESGTWTVLGLAGRTVTAIAANPVLPGYLYAGTTNGAFTSIDGGATWQPGPKELTNLTITAVNFDPTRYHMVYYSTKGNGVLRAPLFR